MPLRSICKAHEAKGHKIFSATGKSSGHRFSASYFDLTGKKNVGRSRNPGKKSRYGSPLTIDIPGHGTSPVGV